MAKRQSETRFFVPDRSSFFSEIGEMELFRFFESIHGPGNPSGRLADGRPFVKLGSVGESTCSDHYLVDQAGLRDAGADQLRSLLLRSGIEWPAGVPPEDVEVVPRRTTDDQGRPIWDIEVRYPMRLDPRG